MVFGDDTDSSLQAAAALVNSAEEPDTLTTLDELRAFYRDHGYSGALPRSADDLAAARSLRSTLRRLLTSDRDGAARIVNEILAAHVITPQVVRHDGLDYHVHAIPQSAPFADRIAVETAVAMIDVIRADEMSRLAVCADPTCAGVVVDLSRNRSRRFCSVTCGNRMAVAAYRARRA
jgi:predicted RNA-binding Zn ribbon-like protein